MGDLPLFDLDGVLQRAARTSQARAVTAQPALQTRSMDVQRFLIGLGLVILAIGLAWPIVASAADLKFLRHLPQARVGTSNRKRH